MANHPPLVSSYFADTLHRKILIPNSDTPTVGGRPVVKVQNSPPMWQPAPRPRNTGKFT